MKKQELQVDRIETQLRFSEKSKVGPQQGLEQEEKSRHVKTLNYVRQNDNLRG